MEGARPGGLDLRVRSAPGVCVCSGRRYNALPPHHAHEVDCLPGLTLFDKQENVLYSGADDSTFRAWDLRCDGPAVYVDRREPGLLAAAHAARRFLLRASF